MIVKPSGIFDESRFTGFFYPINTEGDQVPATFNLMISTGAAEIFEVGPATSEKAVAEQTSTRGREFEGADSELTLKPRVSEIISFASLIN